MKTTNIGHILLFWEVHLNENIYNDCFSVSSSCFKFPLILRQTIKWTVSRISCLRKSRWWFYCLFTCNGSIPRRTPPKPRQLLDIRQYSTEECGSILCAITLKFYTFNALPLFFFVAFMVFFFYKHFYMKCDHYKKFYFYLCNCDKWFTVHGIFLYTVSTVIMNFVILWTFHGIVFIIYLVNFLLTHQQHLKN